MAITEPRYTTVLDFNKSLFMDKEIPNRDSGTPSKEQVASAANDDTTYYLNNGYVIRNTETLYYGTDETATDTLTHETDYTIDYDLGKITLTSEGLTKVGNDTIYATYSFNRYEIKDSYIYDILLRAEDQVQSKTNSVFYDGTAATPDFGIIQDELHDGRGQYDKEYSTDEYPVNDTTTTLNGAVSADDDTINVVSTDGFPSFGTIAIETNKISYTGKTDTSFTGCSGVSAHDDGKTVTSFVVEVALDNEGSEPTWEVQEYNSDYSVDFNSGFIRLNQDAVFSTVLDNNTPPYRVYDRFRVSYQHGYPEIYNDIIKVIHLIAGRELYSGNILNALSRNTDGFSSEGITDIKAQIKEILDRYKTIQVSDTKP